MVKLDTGEGGFYFMDKDNDLTTLRTRTTVTFYIKVVFWKLFFEKIFISMTNETFTNNTSATACDQQVESTHKDRLGDME